MHLNNIVTKSLGLTFQWILKTWWCWRVKSGTVGNWTRAQIFKNNFTLVISASFVESENWCHIEMRPHTKLQVRIKMAHAVQRRTVMEWCWKETTVVRLNLCGCAWSVYMTASWRSRSLDALSRRPLCSSFNSDVRGKSISSREESLAWPCMDRAGSARAVGGDREISSWNSQVINQLAVRCSAGFSSLVPLLFN